MSSVALITFQGQPTPSINTSAADTARKPVFITSGKANEPIQDFSLKDAWTIKVEDVVEHNEALKNIKPEHRHFLIGSQKDWWKADDTFGQKDKVRYEIGKNYSDVPFKKQNFWQRWACRALWSYQSMTRASQGSVTQSISDGCAYPHFHRLSCSEHAVLRIQNKGKNFFGFIQVMAEIFRYNLNCAVTGISKGVKFDAIGAEQYKKELKDSQKANTFQLDG